MTMVSTAFPKAFGIWFKQLDRFDPASFERIVWHWPKSVMTPLGSVLHVRREKVDRAKYEFADLQPMTIHFDGSIDRREVDGNREYTMDLYFAHPGDIVVAKIDLKNGAVGIVPDWQNVVVTGHFAIYQPDRTKLIPEYLTRLIQTSFFKAHLWRNKVGAEGRKEVKLDFFESIEIPLPPLEVQRAIVARWQQARQEITEAEERVKQLEAKIDAQFFIDLGLKPPTDVKKAKAFSVKWKDFLRWSVSYNQAAQSGADITQGKYPVVELGTILEMVQYGTSEKANITESGTPVIRMNNIVDGQLDFTNLKHIQLSQPECDRLLLKDGDILFNRTNSKELVGKCAVFHANGDYVFASYLIRIKTEAPKADPDFVAYSINSPLGRQQINALSRQIIGQANINSVELRSLQIPFPPLDVQRDIIRRVAEGRADIARERAAAKQRALGIEEEIEALILGTKAI